jgi:hypothetical protein
MISVFDLAGAMVQPVRASVSDGDRNEEGTMPP